MRNRSLDVLRGLAIVLMVLDHVCFQIHTPWAWVLRTTVCRAALPLFMLVAGCVWVTIRTPDWRSLLRLLAAAGAASALCQYLHMPSHEILAAFFVVACSARMVVASPVFCACFGLVASVEWPIAGWAYQPGLVLAYLSIGVLGWFSVLQFRLRCRPLEVLGRWPLTCYLGHLALILGWMTWRLQFVPIALCALVAGCIGLVGCREISEPGWISLWRSTSTRRWTRAREVSQQ